MNDVATAAPRLSLALLEKEEQGKAAFRQMIQAWMARNHWSFKTLSDLCEAVLRLHLAPGVADWTPGGYQGGDLRIANDCLWRATRDTTSEPGRCKDVKASGGRGDDWELVTALRRLYASQLNTLTLGQVKVPSLTLFDTLGRLNLHLAELRSGRVGPFTHEKLAERSVAATVLEDADGPFGPEELFSVYLGRLEPAQSAYRLTQEEASEESRRMARRIRQGMMDAGLDLIDDWARFIAVYPISDIQRLNKIRDVALGRSTWSAEQVDDEVVAVEISLSKLRKLQRAEAVEGSS
jgi:hypothetical protein